MSTSRVTPADVAGRTGPPAFDAKLDAARAEARAQQWEVAGAHLRDVLSERLPYSFFARAQKVIDRVAHESGGALRQLRVAIVSSTTTSLLVPVLRALCFRDRIAAEWYEGLHGAFRQEILDAESGLARFRPDVLVIATDWRDLNLPAVVDDEDAAVRRLADEYVALWHTATERLGCHVIQYGFDLPAYDSHGTIAGKIRGSRRRVIELLNFRLQSDAPASVSVLDVMRVALEVGIDRWAQPALWQLARQHPSTDALPVLAEELLAHIRAIAGLSRKVLVCDLDNTLWGGVIGEDGLDGIRVGGSGDGEAYLELQRYLLELKDRGVLLAVCSKNNPEDARLPFERHDGMALRLEDFAAFVANWDDKATNIRRTAETLRLGLDSFVLLDDNPVERAWIRRELPQVAVVELGARPSEYVRALDRGRYFASLTWSAEDRMRTEQYRREAAVAEAVRDAVSLDAFLSSLNMRGVCAPVTAANIDRVVQLVNKTNQFNLTTRRYTRPQVEALVAAPGGWQGVFSLTDCYGDHGIIGVMFCVPGEDAGSWAIDTWLMSCRVLGRQFETFMADALVRAARERGITRVYGEYRATAKNTLVSDLYPRLGFAPAGESDGAARYVVEVLARQSVLRGER
jgi:FkbH-like protein